MPVRQSLTDYRQNSRAGDDQQQARRGDEGDPEFYVSTTDSAGAFSITRQGYHRRIGPG